MRWNYSSNVLPGEWKGVGTSTLTPIAQPPIPYVKKDFKARKIKAPAGCQLTKTPEKPKMKTCGLLPGWYGLTSQDLLTALQMFQNPDQLQDNWLKDEASQTAPVKIEQSS
ncbi:hypothetical protein STEG23_008955 [Scotinomys teguina]